MESSVSVIPEWWRCIKCHLSELPCLGCCLCHLPLFALCTDKTDSITICIVLQLYLNALIGSQQNVTTQPAHCTISCVVLRRSELAILV